MASAKTRVFSEKTPYKCDSMCIRYMNKECITEDENGLCDKPDEYKEIGDVADALRDEYFTRCDKYAVEGELPEGFPMYCGTCRNAGDKEVCPRTGRGHGTHHPWTGEMNA